MKSYSNAKSAVVVGGGISGILSALLLRKKFSCVYLLEKESEIGGLFRSIHNAEGVSFDYGTHFLTMTGIEEIDRLLIDEVIEDKNDLHHFDCIRAANFFCGQLNENSPSMDTRSLPSEIYKKGIEEFLNAPYEDRSFQDCEEKLRLQYGSTFYENVYLPALKKFFQTEPTSLTPDAFKLFMSPRLVALSPEESRKLKKQEGFDRRLSFHSYKEGGSSVVSYYPKKGGMGYWVNAVCKRLATLGVEVVTGAQISEIEAAKGQVRSVRLSDGQKIETDCLVWTAPDFLFGKMVGITPQAGRPQIQTSLIFHYIFDRPFQTESYFVTNYDANFDTFRVSLYPNYAGFQETEGYKCSVEVITAPNRVSQFSSQHFVEELRLMGLISDKAMPVFESQNAVTAGFPVPTTDLVEAARVHREELDRQFSNVIFAGKAQGTTWFVNEVLKETYRSIESLARCEL